MGDLLGTEPFSQSSPGFFVYFVCFVGPALGCPLNTRNTRKKDPSPGAHGTRGAHGKIQTEGGRPSRSIRLDRFPCIPCVPWAPARHRTVQPIPPRYHCPTLFVYF